MSGPRSVMSYPGDPSIPSEIQQRIYQTFRQAVELALKGSRQEALLGCDFVLRLDPRFELARQLADRLQRGANPELFQELLRRLPAAGDPTPPRPREAAAAPSDLRELEALSLEVPEIEPQADQGAVDLLGTFQMLTNQRNWSGLLELARKEERRVTADPRLRQLVEQASSRQEAEPYVKNFLEAARQARALGEVEEVERLLRKVRVLDSTHPDLLAFEAAAQELDAEELAEPSLELPEIDLSTPLDLNASLELDPLGGPPPEVPQAPAPSGDRISQLLDEGQRAFDRGELQAAIDAWSRIFLIDIDHAEAARRIELARQLKAERERQVEELFHEALQKFESGAVDEAEMLFRRVLDLSPGYVLAQEYLARIESGQVATPTSSTSGSLGASLAPPLAAARPLERPSTLSQEILIPPDPEAMAAGEATPMEAQREFAVAAKSSPRAGFPSPKFLAIGGLALVVLLGGGWFVASRWSKLFPNARSGAQQPSGPTGAERLARAQELQKAGQTAQALAELKRVPPQDPAAVEAQLLATQWERLLAEASKPVLSAAQANRRRYLIESARQALASGNPVEARSLMERARALAPLDSDANELMNQTREALKPFAEEIRIFEQEDFEYAANLLWRRRQDGGPNPILDRLLIAAHYNLGVGLLKRGEPARAAERLGEVEELAGRSDQELERLRQFAATYRNRPQDLLYRVFVSQLEVR